MKNSNQVAHVVGRKGDLVKDLGLLEVFPSTAPFADWAYIDQTGKPKHLDRDIFEVSLQ